jgi:hypothetical protein
MEIKGRECEEVKIGEHTYYFITKFKGKEYRIIQGTVLGEMDLKDKDSNKNKAIMFANIPLLFTLFCLKIDDIENVKQEFLDNLDVEEYTKIQDKVVELLTDFFTQLK